MIFQNCLTLPLKMVKSFMDDPTDSKNPDATEANSLGDEKTENDNPKVFTKYLLFFMVFNKVLHVMEFPAGR